MLLNSGVIIKYAVCDSDKKCSIVIWEVQVRPIELTLAVTKSIFYQLIYSS